LILSDYFKAYELAQCVAEQATALIGWIRNHGKVRVIFNQAQKEIRRRAGEREIVLAFIVANLTRWTTHYVAFVRLINLKDALEFAVLSDRKCIISAQVGAAKSTEAERLKAEAEEFCDLIKDELRFWNPLNQVVQDLEPVCYSTNINQKDSTRADTVLLTIVGIYFHFASHPDDEVRVEMLRRIEKQWDNCDQPLFLLALILHPFENTTCFGPRSNFDHYQCLELVVYVCPIHCLYFITSDPTTADVSTLCLPPYSCSRVPA
jgi:hypothetical protein